ncbi:133_t:CDS:2 [Ambispora leptoticha]|uniref:133_t:CDS:1 n=1 Tax=Ambispora leptoticha TaxID=144679 RepID=A0A9N8W4D5_9GLOM|nr:133_t:CDS:2 [Ambispora leptoticha]
MKTNMWPTSDKSKLSRLLRSIKKLRRTTKVFDSSSTTGSSYHYAEKKIATTNPPSTPRSSRFFKNQLNQNINFNNNNHVNRRQQIQRRFSRQRNRYHNPSSVAVPVNRHVLYSLPSLNDLEVFYYGYPKHNLIIEAATVVLRIENGDWVTDEERVMIRAKLGAAICRVFPPGTPEYLSWQALLDLWKRIPDSRFYVVHY